MTDQTILDADQNLRGQYAGIITRLAAFVLDTIALSAFIVFVSWFFKTSISMFQLDQISRVTPLLEKIFEIIFHPLFANLASFLLVVWYYLFFWTLTGQTIGKAVMGIRIIPSHGGKMTFTRSVLRFVGFVVSALPVGLGFLWILIDDRRMTWHDHLAGTSVVYTWDARPDEKFLAQAIMDVKNRQKPVRRIGRGSASVETTSIQQNRKDLHNQ